MKLEFIKYQHFDDQTIRLDGRSYLECTFTTCELVYGGTAGVGMDNCTFTDCAWSFTDAAANAVGFMTKLYAQGGGGRQLIEATIENIRRGVLPSPPEP